MQMEKPSHCLVSVSLITPSQNDNRSQQRQHLATFYSSSALKLTVWYAALCADVGSARAGKSGMYLIGMLKKVSETEHGDMKPLNIETEKKEFKSLKSIKYSCKILQFLYVLFLLPSYKAQDWLVTEPCININFTVLQKLQTVFVQCKIYQTTKGLLMPGI